MSSTFGNNIKLSIFGQSHGKAIGMTLDSVPAGLPVDLGLLQKFLNRRAPGQNAYSTSRTESDRPEFISGIVDGFTCGAPITAIIENTNPRSSDYSQLKTCPRPGHADYTAQIKYGGYQDAAGGGHFSGRLTAPLCIAGGLCKQWLEAQGIYIHGHISAIGNLKDKPLNPVCPETDLIDPDFPVLNPQVKTAMQERILQAKADGDSLGGQIECCITGVPAGLGEPMFDGIESKLAQILFGIPAIKGVEFGSGFAGSAWTGSQNNDAFTLEDGKIVTLTNHSGGILGGISNAMPVLFRVAVKPTPSISKLQKTVDLNAMEETDIQIAGRHDPCIVPRAVAVVEAAAAIAMYDLYLSFRRI